LIDKGINSRYSLKELAIKTVEERSFTSRIFRVLGWNHSTLDGSKRRIRARIVLFNLPPLLMYKNKVFKRVYERPPYVSTLLPLNVFSFTLGNLSTELSELKHRGVSLL